MLMKDTMDFCIKIVEMERGRYKNIGMRDTTEQMDQHLENLKRIRSGQSYGLLKGDDMFVNADLRDSEWEFNQKINPKPQEVHEKFMAEKAEARRVANSKRK